MKDTLNQISELLVQNGVDQPTKEMVINIAIKALIDSGFSVKDAFDHIFGVGKYDEMVVNLYHELHNKA